MNTLRRSAQPITVYSVINIRSSKCVLLSNPACAAMIEADVGGHLGKRIAAVAAALLLTLPVEADEGRVYAYHDEINLSALEP